jgi:hypothetical protein
MKPKPKSAPKPKPSGGGGGGGADWGGDDDTWGGDDDTWGTPSWSGSIAPAPVSAPSTQFTPTVGIPTSTPTRSIPTKSDPSTSPPVPRPTPVSKPSKPSYYKYNGEGDSYTQKSYASVGGGYSVRAYMLLGVGVVASALVGFVAGMSAVRRQRLRPAPGIELTPGTQYTLS